MSDVEADSFKSLALLWDELPLVTSDEKDKNRASRASRTGYVKLTFNFLQEQKLFIAVEDRYYPTDRFHAIVENYFEEYKGKIYKVLGGETRRKSTRRSSPRPSSIQRVTVLIVVRMPTSTMRQRACWHRLFCC